MSLRRVAAWGLAGVLVGVGTGIGTGAARAARPIAPPSGSVVVRHAATPTLTAIGRRGLLLTAVRADSTLVARTAKSAASGNPVWGQAVRLGTIDRRYEAQVALNSRGVGAVAWSQRDRAGSGGSTLVRLRNASGRWSKPYRIPTSFESVFGVSVNRRGTVAVLAAGDKVPAVLAVHHRDGHWKLERLKGAIEESRSVAVAPDDSVYVAAALVERGGTGTGVLGRLSPRGTWKQGKVPAHTRNVGSAEVLVTPDGKVHVVVGRIGSWASTYDTEYYWATRFVVLTRDGARGPWTTTWDRDGATALSAQVSGNDLRMTWTQYADPATDPETGSKVPQEHQLQTGLASQDTATTLSTVGVAPEDFAGNPFASSTADGPGCVLVAWRTNAYRHPSPLTSDLNGTEQTWPDTGAAVRYSTQAATACVAGHGYLARTAHQTARRGTAVNGKVRVESLG